MIQYRILVADDHPLARKAILSLLEGDASFIIVGEAADGKEAFKLCKDLHPDLVLMDINMPNCNGLEATRLVKRTFPNIRIVILSVSQDVGDLFTAVQFGAQGYLLKNMEPEDWITYLHSLLTEDTEVPREIAGRVFHCFRSECNINEPSPSILTLREREIISCVEAGKTNKQIAEHLIITENTVKNHIKNILEKLYCENRVQMAAYAIRHGLTYDSFQKKQNQLA